MTRINWIFPTPRSGLPGALDRIIGPGATRAELLLQLWLPVVATAAALTYASTLEVRWTTTQYIAAAILAFDLMGGIVTNGTSSAKRWFHREGQTAWHHLQFVTLHIAHLMLVAWLFLDWNLSWVAATSAYLLVAASTTVCVPQYLQRPVSLTAFTGGYLLAGFVVSSAPGLEWFLPLLYLKLLVAHLPKEEPYRPDARRGALSPNHPASSGETLGPDGVRESEISGTKEGNRIKATNANAPAG